MDFGRVPENELAAVDFSLPKESKWNKEILKGKSAKLPKICLGCAKWKCAILIGFYHRILMNC